jgi:hypothetical protein
MARARTQKGKSFATGIPNAPHPVPRNTIFSHRTTHICARRRIAKIPKISCAKEGLANPRPKKISGHSCPRNTQGLNWAVGRLSNKKF